MIVPDEGQTRAALALPALIEAVAGKVTLFASVGASLANRAGAVLAYDHLRGKVA